MAETRNHCDYSRGKSTVLSLIMWRDSPNCNLNAICGIVFIVLLEQLGVRLWSDDFAGVYLLLVI
jgi:hypothetical protein